MHILFGVELRHANAGSERWELYKLLSEPTRLELLALTSVEELSIGELTELLRESQPNVSKHVSALRRVGLLRERKQGTRVFVGLAETAERDPLIADAITTGMSLATETGSMARVADVLRARDLPTREFFGRLREEAAGFSIPAELPAYLSALAPLITHRKLAIDAGTGDGKLLEILAPLFERVIGIEREAAQLELAKERLAHRKYSNVTLVEGAYDDAQIVQRVRKLGAADVVFASRVLHHAAQPEKSIKALSELLSPHGTLICIDYAAHDDERLRSEEADVWLGFSAEDLARYAKRAGFAEAHVNSIPLARNGAGPDRHLQWHVLVAKRTHTVV